MVGLPQAIDRTAHLLFGEVCEDGNRGQVHHSPIAKHCEDPRCVAARSRLGRRLNRQDVRLMRGYRFSPTQSPLGTESDLSFDAVVPIHAGMISPQRLTLDELIKAAVILLSLVFAVPA